MADLGEKGKRMNCDECEEKMYPVLDTLEQHLAAGAEIKRQGGRWWLFDANGGGICSGETIRGMLVNLIFTEG